MSNSPVLPVGSPTDLLSGGHVSGVAEYRFKFEKKVAKIYVVGAQVGGSAVSASFQLLQGLQDAPAGPPTGESLLTDDASQTLEHFGGSDTPAVATYPATSLLYSGYGVFRLLVNVGANGNSFFNLTVMGVPA